MTHDAFWDWWQGEGATACEAAIADGTVESLVDEITARVHEVGSGLAWELGPGEHAEHALVVSPEGNPELRAVARRWLLAAPPPTATWEYADARRAAPDPASGGMRIGDHHVDFGAIRIGAAQVGNHVDVAVHHPLLRQLPEQARGSVVFIALDHTLGETECETWIGAVEIALDEPADAVTLDGLRELVAQVRDAATTDDGQPVWVLLQGERDGVPLMAAAQVPLAPSWAPHLDTHLAVTIPFADATDDGMPTPAALDALRDVEDHLSEQLAGAGRLVAHETEAGHRTLHFYLDSTQPMAALADVDATARPDPSWHQVRHLRT